MNKTAHYRPLPRRFRRQTLLLVGCGDVGGRIGAQSLARHPADRLRVIGTSRRPEQAAALRALGILPLPVDLDERAGLRRLAGLSRWMIDLAPPPPAGATDPRSTRLIAALARNSRRPLPAFRSAARDTARIRPARASGEPMTAPAPGAVGPLRLAPPRARRRWVYVSTTGVYGDCAGASFDETRPVAPASARAVRRVDAERRFRAAGARELARVAILRVPGIYADDRLPLERLRKGLPALRAEDDVFTNHVHADDLARIARAALVRGRQGRVVHAVDDSDLRMGDYFDRVADAFALPRPPRVARAKLAALVTPAMLSFMSESRRLANRRLKGELRLRLRFANVDATLAHATLAPSSDPAPFQLPA
ncbi:SDR family NAD(P)-dependent oxidoreductase [Quisquiliibacterium transsilvanicum]|uniref:SDR family NAD(P)-dependent oxidoreductase n=1 Tax=Quisquiliibacterium transsilvanicum TaxID=1549638 RepID=UPI0031E70276